jgi:hypothetical protein
MRLTIIFALLLGTGAKLAFAQTVPPSAPTTGAQPSRATIVTEKKADEAAVADCEQMWDPGTHMSRQDWSRTCRRVQDRLQRSEFK